MCFTCSNIMDIVIDLFFIIYFQTDVGKQYFLTVEVEETDCLKMRPKEICNPLDGDHAVGLLTILLCWGGILEVIGNISNHKKPYVLRNLENVKMFHKIVITFA